MRARAHGPTVDLSRPVVAGAGKPGAGCAYAVVSAAAAGEDFVELAADLGRGPLRAIVPALLGRQLGGATGGEMSVALRGCERPGNHGDAVHTLRALGSGRFAAQDFVSPGPVTLTDTRKLFAAEDAFPWAEIWLASGAPAAAQDVLVFVELDGARVDQAPDWRAIAGGPGFGFLDVGALAPEGGRVRLVDPVVSVTMPTERGHFQGSGYEGRLSGSEYLALIRGPIDLPGVPVHVHADCLFGDALGGTACACGGALREAFQRIERAGAGVVVHHPGSTRPACPAIASDWAEVDIEVGHVLADLGLVRPSLTTNRRLSRELMFAAIREAEAGDTAAEWL